MGRQPLLKWDHLSNLIDPKCSLHPNSVARHCSLNGLDMTWTFSAQEASDDQSRGSTLGWQLAALSQYSLQIIQAMTGIMVWGLLIGQLCVSIWHGIYFGSNIHQPWQVGGIFKAPGRTGRWLQCTAWSFSGSSRNTWTLISQTSALRRCPFLSGQGSEKSHALRNDVTASKPVFGPSTIANSKRLSEVSELSRMPAPLQPAGVLISGNGSYSWQPTWYVNQPKLPWNIIEYGEDICIINPHLYYVSMSFSTYICPEI